MNNLILTYAGTQLLNKYIEYVLITLKTARQYTEKNTDTVLLTDTNELNKGVITACKALQVEIEQNYKPLDLNSLGRDRWYAYENTLRQFKSKYNKVLICDARDVLFQGDPFSFQNQNHLNLFSDGFIHAQCSWNSNDQAKLAKALGEQKSFATWPMINASTIYGSTSNVIRWVTLITNTNKVIPRVCSDQAIVNRLVRDNLEDPDYNITLIEDTDYYVSGYGLFAPGVKRFTEPEQKWENKQLLHTNGKPYTIFHQWDRTPYAKEIMSDLFTDWNKLTEPKKQPQYEQSYLELGEPVG